MLKPSQGAEPLNTYTDFDSWMDAAEVAGYRIVNILCDHWIARDKTGLQTGRFECEDETGWLQGEAQ